MAATSTRATRSRLQLAAGIVGATFLAVGILGFVPGVTQNLGDISFAGHESTAELLGIFQVSILHNLVHVLFGVVGLMAASSAAQSKAYLVYGGAVYLALFVYGIVIDRASDANFVPVNTADNWLHLGLGAGMVLLGLALSASTGRTNRPVTATR